MFSLAYPETVVICPAGARLCPSHSLQFQGYPFLHSRMLSPREREEKKGKGREKENLEIITAIILTFRTPVKVQSYSDP